MLEINNFSKIYKGNIRAVDTISLEVKEGEIFGFIGHNGAGKTTTIKSIVGINEFDEGDILINGMSIKDNPIECKKIMAYIPDNPDLYESLTAIQYLNFVADVYGVSETQREELIKKYGDAFEITNNLGSLISALIHKPKLLVLDEPFVGLDPKASHTLKGIMKEICEEGASIFFSSHVLEVVEKLCSRIAIIKDGKIAAYGTVEEVKGTSSLEDVFMELIDNE